MFTKYIVPALCATNLLNGVEASSRHRHMHKRDLIYAATETEIYTDYVTVTVVEGEQPATTSQQAVTAVKPSTTQSPVALPSTSVSVPAAAPTIEAAASSPTTLATAVKPTTVEQSSPVAAAPTTPTTVVAIPTTTAAVPTTVAAPVSSATAAATSASSGSTGGKRGLAYNDASLVSSIIAVGSGKFSWAYDWGFSSGGLKADISYIPMLWGPTHYNSAWDTAAKAAVTAKTEALLSFNECDNAGQANLSPGDAANYHKQYLGPYSGQIKIAAPSITSSTDANQGLDWLKQFFTACGTSCPVDFCNVHWYGPGGEAGAIEFLNFLSQAHTTCGKPLWVTEWAATSGDEDAFMKYALNQLDTNSTLNFVEKYSYFYLAPGSLFDSSTALSTLGQTYATA